MTAFSKLTYAVTLLGIAAWAYAAPPQVIGNRPVRLEVDVPDDEPPAGQKRRQQTPPRQTTTHAAPSPATKSTERDRRTLAAVLPDDKPEAQPAGGAAEPRSPAAELKHAREQLQKCTTISAKVVEKIEVLEKSYKAEGRYLQTALKPNDWRMRLELVVKIGKSEGALLEICDGEVLWTRLEIDQSGKQDKKAPKDQMLTRRNVAEIMSAARKLGDVKVEKDLIVALGLGGLPALIAAIEQDMKFDATTEGTLRDRPVSVVHGTWSDAFAQKLRGPQQQPQQQATPSLLPVFVPDAVRIYIDRETGFPLRIMYLKNLVGRGTADNPIQKPMVTLDFLDVVLNQPINNQDFDYQPPEGVTPIEQTKAFVDRLTPPESKSPAGPGPQPRAP
jgi:hypothetical protein